MELALLDSKRDKNGHKLSYRLRKPQVAAEQPARVVNMIKTTLYNTYTFPLYEGSKEFCTVDGWST